jgi:hypothetical protein
MYSVPVSSGGFFSYRLNSSIILGKERCMDASEAPVPTSSSKATRPTSYVWSDRSKKDLFTALIAVIAATAFLLYPPTAVFSLLFWGIAGVLAVLGYFSEEYDLMSGRKKER